MMAGAFLRVTFTGANGSGLGVLVLHNGSVVGADTGGGIYEGSYTENTAASRLDFAITLSFPAGAIPVQTGIALPMPMSVPIHASVLQDDIGTERPTLVQTPLGPVNVLLKKLRDFP
jgi:hypothetical protein